MNESERATRGNELMAKMPILVATAIGSGEAELWRIPCDWCAKRTNGLVTYHDHMPAEGTFVAECAYFSGCPYPQGEYYVAPPGSDPDEVRKHMLPYGHTAHVAQ